MSGGNEMVIVGLDLGSKCGWAVLDGNGERRASGTWDLGVKRYDGAGMRYVMLEAHLFKLTELAEGGLDGGDGKIVIAYEECVALRGDASRVYNAMLGVVQAACERWSIPYQGIPIATVKRTATGKGNANKEMMVAAAVAKWPICLGLDDNAADAIWVAEALRRELVP